MSDDSVFIVFHDGAMYKGGWDFQTNTPLRHGMYQMKIVPWYLNYFLGCVYDGDWLDANAHGNGSMKWFEYRPYQNTVQEGVFYPNLDGVTVYKQYHGEFSFNKFDGLGKMETDRFKYTGNFSNGECHGRGVYIRTSRFPSSCEWDVRESDNQYNGEFVHDKLEGYGVFVRALRTPWKQQDMYRCEGFWKNDVLLPGGTVTCGDYTEVCGDDYEELLKPIDHFGFNKEVVRFYIVEAKIFSKYKMMKLGEFRELHVDDANIQKLCDYLHAALLLESRFDFESTHKAKNTIFRTHLLNNKNLFQGYEYLIDNVCNEQSVRRRHRYKDDEVALDRLVKKVHNKVLHKKNFEIVPYVDEDCNFVHHDCDTTRNDAIGYFDETQGDCVILPAMYECMGIISEFLDVEDKYRMLTTCRAMYNLRFLWKLCPEVLDVSTEKPSVAINMVSSAGRHLKSLKLSHTFDDSTLRKCYQEIRYVTKTNDSTTAVRKRKRGMKDAPHALIDSQLVSLDVTDSKVTWKALKHLATPALLEFSQDNRFFDIQELHKYAPNIRKLRFCVGRRGLDETINHFNDLEDLTLSGNRVEMLLASEIVFAKLKRLTLIGVKSTDVDNLIERWTSRAFPFNVFPMLECLMFRKKEDVVLDNMDSLFFGNVEIIHTY